MNDSIFDHWIRGDSSRSRIAHDLCRLYSLQERFLFQQYEPAKASGLGLTPFLKRLDRWISCFDEADKWAAFHSLRYFLFVGQEETDELYRCAVRGKVVPWLIDRADIDIFSDDVDKRIESEFAKAWLCPVTDSLRINSLIHTTGVKTKATRPDWYSQMRFAEPEKIKNYEKKQGLKYLVLFEDFVGSGSQCSKILKFALDSFSSSVFFSPLVICQQGHDAMMEMAEIYSPKFTYCPVVVIPKNCLVNEECWPGEPRSFSDLRKAILSGYASFGENIEGAAFGYGSTGCLYSSYSNCPNNTPPIYHFFNERWPHPLFPREARV